MENSFLFRKSDSFSFFGVQDIEDYFKKGLEITLIIKDNSLMVKETL